MREEYPAPSQSMRIRVVKWVSVAFFIASITALILAATLNEALRPEWFQERTVAIAVVSALVAIAAAGLRWHLRDGGIGTSDGNADDHPIAPLTEQARFAVDTRQAFTSLCEASFRTIEPVQEELLYSILNPGHLGDRASKTVSLVAPYHKTRLSRTLTVHSSGALVPVLKARKSTLRDGLSCELDGSPVATLSRLESHGAMLELINILTRVTFKDALEEPAISNLASTLISGVASDAALPQKQLRNLTDTVSSVARLYPNLVEESDVQDLQALLSFASAYYCLIALIPSEHDEGMAGEEGRARKRKLVVEFFERLQQGPRTHVDQVRRIIGLSPREFGILVPEALDSSSVHVHCQAPPGMYTFRAIPRVIFPEPIQTNTLRPHKQVSDTLGLDYVHAYFRDFHGPLVNAKPDSNSEASPIDRPVPVLEVEFRETPPGLLLPLLLTSAYLAAIVLAVGWNPDYLAQGGSPILLGIPAVLAGWMVTRFDVQALRRVSIPTALLACWFVVNTGVVLTNATAAATVRPSLSAIPVVGWFVVTATCVAHLASLAYVYVNRMIRHQQRLRVGDE
jgi:hypothetical protein